MPKTAIKIGLKDHGRRMSLEDFDLAEVQEGYIYELGRGVIVVSDVPKRRHLVQVGSARSQFETYKIIHPGRIDTIAGSGECKLLIPPYESERHPDVAVYLLAPTDDENLWATWIPDLAIEVVSPGSEQRDYEEKPQEYLRFGVREYWILDADKEEMLVHTRSGNKWEKRVIRSGEMYRPRWLPGFEFDCGLVFAAASKVGE